MECWHLSVSQELIKNQLYSIATLKDFLLTFLLIKRNNVLKNSELGWLIGFHIQPIRAESLGFLFLLLVSFIPILPLPSLSCYVLHNGIEPVWIYSIKSLSKVSSCFWICMPNGHSFHLIVPAAFTRTHLAVWKCFLSTVVLISAFLKVCFVFKMVLMLCQLLIHSNIPKTPFKYGMITYLWDFLSSG